MVVGTRGRILVMRKNKKLEVVFKDREKLPVNIFYEKYYLDKNVPFNVVKNVRDILEEELGIDLSRLSAKDDFSKNLGFLLQYDSLADIAIVQALESSFSIKYEDIEAEKMRTIDDIIFSVTKKLS